MSARPGAAAAVLITLLAGCGGATATKPVAADKPAAAAAAAKPSGPALTFPGKLDKDIAVKDGAAIDLSGWKTTAGALKRITDPGFGEQMCTAVTMTNTDSKSQDYTNSSWKLQGPDGDTKDLAISDSNNKFGNGSLVPAGKKAGTLCFSDPGVKGAYVVLWQPDLFSNKDRGAWLNKI